MKCEKCNNEHDGSFGSGRFCSRTCANSRTWTEEDKKKKSESAKKSEKVKKEILSRRVGERNEKKICPICKNFFIPKKNINQIFCSRKCYLEDCDFEFHSKPPGGIRKNSSHGKRGYYKGFYCDSSYELAYVIWCLENGHKIERNKESFEYFDPERNAIFKFYPDFLVNGKLIEIKGWYIPRVDFKLDAVKKSGREIKILYGEDLEEAFEIAKNVTGLPKGRLYEAYDNHKPKYNHRCACGAEFSNEKKNSVYCSQKCAGKYGGRKLKIQVIA
jgi:hypothetical protein